MRKINPEHVAALIDLINHRPFFELLSMVIKDIGLGYCIMEVNIEDKHHNPFGGIHGGVYATVIDTAAF